MFRKNFSNADIANIDWAQRDRAAMLGTLHSSRAPRPVTASSGWGTDVAGLDSRSVHAYLAGKGDLRTLWWNVFNAVYHAVVPGATLERAMYSFHKFHHSITLARLGFARSVDLAASEIENDGVWAAAHGAITREIQR